MQRRHLRQTGAHTAIGDAKGHTATPHMTHANPKRKEPDSRHHIDALPQRKPKNDAARIPRDTLCASAYMCAHTPPLTRRAYSYMTHPNRTRKAPDSRP